MNSTQQLRTEIERIGYSAIIDDYVFSDVFASPPRNRAANLAVFTQTPPSYRNAALAVVTNSNGHSAEQLASEYRALGAPLLFVIERNEVTTWQVRSKGAPRPIARVRQDQLSGLFSAHSSDWSPSSIQRAKSIGQLDRVYQLDFVDIGLLPAIEGEIHAKLDRIINDTLAAAIGAGPLLDNRRLFYVVFRLLAAKILQDRAHAVSSKWDNGSIPSILDVIEKHYSLPNILLDSYELKSFNQAWRVLNSSINFQNISSDDLAFVYENTLVTPDIRRDFGTHSTPSIVAEHIVSRLELHKHDPKELLIYEPFAGAAVFLTSALRHMRELLPVNWTDRQRHEFLIQRLSGDDRDAFACEVATLSLILADYPNHNGWRICDTDLFEDGVLRKRMRGQNIILCNPPFEAFSREEKERYPRAANSSSKALAVLSDALDSHPLALGFVLPQSFLRERQFSEQRRRIERLYGSVELVELPDRTFRFSEIESALLIARQPRPLASRFIRLKSTEVADRDRVRFLKTGETTTSRELTRRVSRPTSGNLWIPRLPGLWTYLENAPRLGQKLRPSRGLEWNYAQRNAESPERREGDCLGLLNSQGVAQFVLNQPGWLDYRADFIRRGYGQDWGQPKLIINAARLHRGPWRISAAVDFQGLVFSQQFIGLWPISPVSRDELFSLCAILNGPVANAFITGHSPARFRLTAIRNIPIPVSFPKRLPELVEIYCSQLSAPHILDSQSLERLLLQIDAEVLAAYDLPPRLERELLESFRGEERPSAHSWKQWFPPDFQPYLPLHEYLSGNYKRTSGHWPLEVFESLPPQEASALRDYLD
jgi:hypothetical protein